MVNELAIIGCAAVLMLSLIWERKNNMRKKREKFKRELQGYKFGSLNELQDFWRGTIDISFGRNNREFDPNYHGNLLETLKTIDEAVRKEVIRWNA